MGKGVPSPSYAQVAMSQAQSKEEDWQVIIKKSRKKEKKERKAKDPMQKSQGTVAKPRLK